MHGYTFMTPRGGGYASGKGDPWKVGETRASEPEPYVASVDPWGALALAGPTDTVLCLVELGGERQRDPGTWTGPVQRLVHVKHMEEGLRRFAAQFADEAYRHTRQYPQRECLAAAIAYARGELDTLEAAFRLRHNNGLFPLPGDWGSWARWPWVERVCDEGSAGVHRHLDAQRAAFNDPAQPWVKCP